MRGRQWGVVVALGTLMAAMSCRPAPETSERPVSRLTPAQQLSEFRMNMASLRDEWDSYNLSDLAHGRGDTLLDLAFRLRGDTLQLAIEASWFPRDLRMGDSIPTRRWTPISVQIHPDEILAPFCNGPGIRDSMLVFAVAVPLQSDTFASPRLAWLADTVDHRVVPIPVAGLHCRTPLPFTDAVITESGGRTAKYAVKSWWEDVRMMAARIAAKHPRGGAGS